MKVPIDPRNIHPERLLSKAYEDNFEWCKRYVRKNTGSDDDAADIFQESISVAWMNLTEGKFEGDSRDFNAYIRQICKHKWINELKVVSRSPIIHSSDLSQHPSITDLGTVEEDDSRGKLLQTSFDLIGEKCKELLGRFYFKRESLAQLAKWKGTTEESMKTIKYRCMMRLRKAYLEQFKENE